MNFFRDSVTQARHRALAFRIGLEHQEQGVLHLNEPMDERAILLAQFMLEQNTTVRGVAKHFGISKSTVHKDLSEKLIHLNPALYQQVRILLDQNKAERHIRGGLATKQKYAAQK